MKAILMNLIFLMVGYKLSAQINCDDYFNNDDSTMGYMPHSIAEKVPQPIKGIDSLYYQIYSPFIKREDYSYESGTFYVEFVIDKNGNVPCARILNGYSDSLNVSALKLIKATKFSPATRNGINIVSKLTYRFPFGKESLKKK